MEEGGWRELEEEEDGEISVGCKIKETKNFQKNIFCSEVKEITHGRRFGRW